MPDGIIASRSDNRCSMTSEKPELLMAPNTLVSVGRRRSPSINSTLRPLGERESQAGGDIRLAIVYPGAGKEQLGAARRQVARQGDTDGAERLSIGRLWLLDQDQPVQGASSRGGNGIGIAHG